MSKHNKVNPDHYHQAGRLTPDEWARERMKQQSELHQHQPPERQPDHSGRSESREDGERDRE